MAQRPRLLLEFLTWLTALGATLWWAGHAGAPQRTSLTIAAVGILLGAATGLPGIRRRSWPVYLATTVAVVVAVVLATHAQQMLLVPSSLVVGMCVATMLPPGDREPDPPAATGSVAALWLADDRVRRERDASAGRVGQLAEQLEPRHRPMLKLVRDDATLEVTASDAGYLVHHIKQLPHDREQVHQACTTDSHDGEIEAHTGDHTFWYPPALFVTHDQAIACAHQFATDGGLAPDITWVAETRGRELVRVPWQQELA